MAAMPGKRATIAARLHWGAMPSQDCLYVRLSGYLEARRHAPDRDQAPDLIADGQDPHSGGTGGPEQQGGLGDRER